MIDKNVFFSLLSSNLSKKNNYEKIKNDIAGAKENVKKSANTRHINNFNKHKSPKTLIQKTMINEQIKFYADTFYEKNKYFCFKINDFLALKEVLWQYFDKGWNIRSAWHEKINTDTGEIICNDKLNVTELLGEYLHEK